MKKLNKVASLFATAALATSMSGAFAQTVDNWVNGNGNLPWKNGTANGYAAYQVSPRVKTHEAWGLGSYSFFNQGVDVFADNAFLVPNTTGVLMHDLLTLFLDATNGHGAIDHVVNDAGGSSSIANPDAPVTVTDYP